MIFIDQISKITEPGDYCLSKCINDLWHYDGHWKPFSEEEIKQFKEQILKRIDQKYQTKYRL